MVAERGHFVHYVHFPQDTSAAVKQCGTVAAERGHCVQYVHFPKDTSAAVKQLGTVVGERGHCVHYVHFPKDTSAAVKQAVWHRGGRWGVIVFTMYTFCRIHQLL